MDRYASFANSAAGRVIVKRLGLPQPIHLRRYAPDEPEFDGPFLTGGVGRMPLATLIPAPVGQGGAGPGDDTPPSVRYRGLVFDATGITDLAGLRAVYEFFSPTARSLLPSGRVVLLGTPPAACTTVAGAAAQRALEGFVRSLGKEIGHGGTANLVYVWPGAEGVVESTLRFLLSARSAYVSGQVIEVHPAHAAPVDWTRPLAGKIAAVTGAARGIGAAIAAVLARDGATVVAIDVPAAGAELASVANDIRGAALQLDLTGEDAPRRLASYLTERYGRLDILVHNAGITRDRTLARMSDAEWDAVLNVNLRSQELLTQAGYDLLPPGGRIVSIASVAGVAGNRGQTNYATSKAGVIGLMWALAPALADRGVTANAVAPGFIETRMTARMPLMIREAGRRLNSLAQGGQPVDVAETVAWLASPGSAGITGTVVRVCGQSLLGA